VDPSTVVDDGLPGQQRPKQLEVRIRDATAGTHVHAELCVFLGAVTEAEHVGDPPATDVVEDVHLLGQSDRIVEGEQHGGEVEGQLLGTRWTRPG
jgi:hypothetical protein